MSIKNIIKGNDSWTVILQDEKSERLTFEFGFYPNKWFVDAHKSYLEIEFSLANVKFETIQRYHYSLKHFYSFLEESNIQLFDFSDLDYNHIRLLLHYLKQGELSNSTQNLVIAALKRLISIGRSFEEPGFPTTEIFDGRESRALRVQEEYTTEYIPDSVMKDIEDALKVEENILLKSLLEIIIDTGLRISEVLNLKTDCITLDFKDKPLLKVYSKKTDSERYIPASNRVKNAVEKATTFFTKARSELKTDYVFVYYSKYKKENIYLNSYNARYYLNNFIKRNQFVDENGDEFIFTFHSFRHKLGTDMLNNDMNHKEIMQHLGHTSTRSTEYYAKVQPKKLMKEYEDLGFIGMVTKEVTNKSAEKQNTVKSISDETLTRASLPDGICNKPINNEGNLCAKFNMCILCPKFVTTPGFLPVHKKHLQRLQKDRLTYMSDEFIGTEHHLDSIETSLKTIIKKLEMISNE